MTRDEYKAPSLLQAISSPNNREETMNPAKGDLSDEDIFALPKDDDTSSDEENTRRAADIKPTQFTRRMSEEPNVRAQSARGWSSGVTQSKSSSTPVSGNTDTGTRNTRASRQKSPESSAIDSNSSNKRKHGENGDRFGSGIADQFGQVRTKKGKTYSSVRQKSNSNRPQMNPLQGMSVVHLREGSGSNF